MEPAANPAMPAKPVAPAIIVIFGITGDLSQRKLLPALYHLFKDALLDERTVILGISRRDITTEEMVHQVETSIKAADGTCDPKALQRIQNALRMHTMSQTEPHEYEELKKLLDTIESEKAVCMDRLYYLSVPPQMFGVIVENLGKQQLNQSCQHGKASTRLLIEKPFGYDLGSARDLISETGKYFSEEQLFRIDHYVAKDPVQNIIAFRKTIPEIEKLWNAKNITKITITVIEKIDIEGRAVFYDELGALRDFVQSHMLQMLAITAMDLPKDASSESIHASRLGLLQSIEPISEAAALSQADRGQYDGYRDEVKNPDSITETFARVHLSATGSRWEGTDMTLQTGKAMPEKKAEIVIDFGNENGRKSSLLFYIQPENGIQLTTDGPLLEPMQTAVADFNTAHPPSTQNILGYERVFIDAINGDHALFTTSQEVLRAWEIVNDVVKVWGESGKGLRFYPKGSAELLQEDESQKLLK